MRQERKRLYEGMYIFNATLSEEARKKALEKISSSIEKKGGEIHKVHEWGRRKLAYEINKKKEGFYYIIYFSLLTQHIRSLWDEYHLNEDLLRYMTTVVDSVKESFEFKPLKQI